MSNWRLLVPAFFGVAALAACGGTPQPTAVDPAAVVAPAAPPAAAPVDPKLLQLQGETAPINSGLVEVTAGQQVWKGSIDNGRFALDITPEDSEVVLVKALGVGQQARVVFASLLGTGAELRTQAGDAVLDSSETSTLKLNTLTTAKFGQLPTAELTADNVDAARRSVNLLEAYQVATALQLLVDDATQPLPQGFDDILQLAQSSTARLAFVQSLSKTDAYASAAATVGSRKAIQLSESTLLGTVTLFSQPASAPVLLTFKNAGKVDILYSGPQHKANNLQTDSAGNYTGGFTVGTSADTGTWSINPDGDVVTVVFRNGVSYDSSFLNFEGSCAPDPNQNGIACLRRNTVKKLLIRFESGLYGRLLASVETTSDNRFPTASNSPVQTSTVTNFQVVTLPSGYYKFSTSELADRTTLLPVFDQNNAASDDFTNNNGNNAPALNTEFVKLKADGTGTVPRLSGVTLTWQLQDDSRVLLVNYSNGDRVSYRKSSREKPQPYSFNGSSFDGDSLNDLRDLFDVLGFGAQEFALTASHAVSSPSIAFATTDVFTTAAAQPKFVDANVPGHYNQYGLGREIDDNFADFFLELKADHTGSQITVFICPSDPFSPDFQDFNCSFSGQIVEARSSLTIFWSVNNDGQLVMERRRFFDANNTPAPGAAGRNCTPVGSTDSQGRTCKVVDRRVETLLKQHGTRFVTHEARSIRLTPLGDAFAAPIDGVKPFLISRFYDRTALDN